jgi:beta-1,4-mannosyltransferase
MTRETRSDRLSVAVFPPAEPGGNPYLPKLNAELERRGVQLVPAQSLSPRWVERARGHVDVVHLHWLEYIVHGSGRGLERLARTHVRAARYALALHRLQAGGIRTVWTVHNRRPHERQYPWVDDFLVRRTAAVADALVLHSPTAARRMASDLRRPIRAWVAPHPHYQGLYPADGRTRGEQRDSYGLEESAFVYLMFGQLRRYKRIPEAIQAFRALEARDGRLVVAGAPVEEGVEAQIRRAAGEDPRVRVLARHVPDDEVSALFELADAAILNHGELFTSGALLLGLSYGLPVVAPENGSARDVVAPPALEPFGLGGLTRALGAVRTGDQAARRRAALRAVEPYTYDALAESVMKAYHGDGGQTVSAGAFNR